MTDQFTLPAVQQADFDAFKQRIHRKTGIDLNLYKAPQMHRRLMGLVERANLRSFSDYLLLIERDPAEFAVFLDRMTINVSELFRNPEKWMELREWVLPALLSAGRPLRIWSAGCSYGAEPYSLAMLLHELAPGRRHFLLATDIDRRILEKAREGVFTETDIRQVPPACRKRYLTPHGVDWQVTPELRDRVTFRAHNLLNDAFEPNFDLILCRNVVIYFTDEAKDRLFQRFADSLRVGGVLFIGSTERIFNYREIGLDSKLAFFYEKCS